MNLGQWEWAIGEVIVLPLLFFELYRLRRSQRRDRENAPGRAGSRDVVHPDTKHVAATTPASRLK